MFIKKILLVCLFKTIPPQCLQYQRTYFKIIMVIFFFLHVFYRQCLFFFMCNASFKLGKPTTIAEY